MSNGQILRAACIAVAIGVWAMGCANILGIEEREAVGAYPGPYDGCDENDCEGCITDSHAKECRALGGGSGGPDGGGSNGGNNNNNGGTPLAECVDTVPQDQGECFQCMCDKCVDDYDECAVDEDCLTMFSCIVNDDCEPDDGSSADSCYSDAHCKDVIDAAGGLDTELWDQIKQIVGCTLISCPCDDQPDEPNCRPDIEDCGQCMDSCNRCECQHGPSSAACNLDCGYDPKCSPAVNNCGDCSGECDRCLCMSGGDVTQCPPECSNAVAGGFCSPYSNACNDCQSELGYCDCGYVVDQDPFYNYAGCLETTGLLDCFNSDDPTPVERCICEVLDGVSFPEDCPVRSGLSCADLGGCEQCQCERCPLQFAACWDEPGCRDIHECLSAEGLGACGNVVDLWGGVDAPAYQKAEALISCGENAACSPNICPVPGGGNPPQNVMCQGQPCEDYVLSDGVLGACCAPPGCGLFMDYYGGRTQQGDPICAVLGAPIMLDPQCLPRPVNREPYYGDELMGCCTPMGQCGLADEYLGLGCVPLEGFGFPPQPCNGGQ